MFNMFQSFFPSNTPSFKKGSRVRLTGLTSDTSLNGAEGVITAEPQGDPLRYPVRITAPPHVASAYSKPIAVKAANLEPFTAATTTTAAADSSQARPGRPTAPTSTAPAAPTTAGGSSGARPSTSTSNASASTRGGREGGGAAAAGGVLAPEVRRATATKCVETFIDALNSDLYPMEAIEGIFGVSMSDGDTRKDHNDLSTWPMGQLVFNAWITIRNWYSADKEEEYGMLEVEAEQGMEAMRALVEKIERELRSDIVAALLGGRLPVWYKEQLQKLMASRRASAYAVEIVRRGFRGIPWDTVMLDRLSGAA